MTGKHKVYKALYLSYMRVTHMYTMRIQSNMDQPVYGVTDCTDLALLSSYIGLYHTNNIPIALNEDISCS
jgi:hypothetical protein